MTVVEKFHYIYDPMRITYGLMFRYKSGYGEYLIEIYQKQKLTTELKRIIKVEAKSFEEVYESATLDLIRWHELANYKKRREQNETNSSRM